MSGVTGTSIRASKGIFEQNSLGAKTEFQGQKLHTWIPVKKVKCHYLFYHEILHI